MRGYPAPRRAKSIVFYKRNKATLEDVSSPQDVFTYSQERGNPRWGVLVEPIVVGLCPTDQAGGNLDFPPGSIRSFGDPQSPAVAGHEFVGRVVRANEYSAKKLFKKNIAVGDAVVVDVNIGCGECFECRRGDPPLYCRNGATFLGIGTTAGASWVKKQTGRNHLPGAYTKGFVVVPASNVHKIPMRNIHSMGQLAVFSQSDAVACAKTSCDAMGISFFEKTRGFKNPTMLVIGAGRVGAWHVAVARELLPNIVIYMADINKKNLDTVGDLFRIPHARRYLVSKKAYNPYSRKSISAHFGKELFFDFIVDAAGHHVFNGNIITRLMKESLASGGVFCTTAHVGVRGVDAGHPALILGMKKFLNGLSPQNNFKFAISFLSKNVQKFTPFMTEIKGGLHEKLAHIVESGGGEYKKKMGGTTFYSVIHRVGFKKRKR